MIMSEEEFLENHTDVSLILEILIDVKIRLTY